MTWRAAAALSLLLRGGRRDVTVGTKRDLEDCAWSHLDLPNRPVSAPPPPFVTGAGVVVTEVGLAVHPPARVDELAHLQPAVRERVPVPALHLVEGGRQEPNLGVGNTAGTEVSRLENLGDGRSLVARMVDEDCLRFELVDWEAKGWL